jgi:hypothetical protein
VRIDGELPFRGEVVWLTPEQGGSSTGPPPTPSMQDYAATAYVPPASGSGPLASFVLRVADRTAWRSAATAGWLVAENAAAVRRARQRGGRDRGIAACRVLPRRPGCAVLTQRG